MDQLKPVQTYEGELLRMGTTAERTAMVAGDVKIPDGWQFYDTTLNQPLWWNGSAFLEADGTAPA